MKIGITHRLFLALLAAAFLSVVSMFLIMQWSVDRGFNRYVNSLEQTHLTRLAGQLEEQYALRGSWDFLRDDPGAWQRLLSASLPDDGPEPGNRHERREMPPPPGHGPDRRFFLLDADRRPLVAPAEPAGKAELRPLHQRGRVTGYLGLLPRKRLSDERQLRFLKEQRLAFALIGGVVLLLAAGLSLPLANRLVRPVRALARATDRLAAGEFETRVAVTSQDELGQLARDFNALALTLEKNEQARRQWVADISHELRTPLAVLRGEIEALQDDVRQPTPAALHSLHGEALRLGRLVDDLYQLSLSDLGAMTYRKEERDLAELLDEAVVPLRNECETRRLTLTVAIDREKRVPVFGDQERLRQLFANLLDNALKYTDPPGRIVVRLASDAGRATVCIEDSAPGVAEGELEKLFDRLYRVETSRNRQTGGAGLGLAICRNIVEAHEGTIEAEQSPLGGLRIKVTLPVTGRG